MVGPEGGDGEILTIIEAAEVLGVDPARVAAVVGGGGVRPVCIVGGRRLLRRGQLREVKALLEGKKPRPPDPGGVFPSVFGLVRPGADDSKPGGEEKGE